MVLIIISDSGGGHVKGFTNSVGMAGKWLKLARLGIKIQISGLF